MTDPYVYSNGVLKNKLGIKNQDKLAKQEHLLVGQRMNELKEKPVRGDFTIKHLQQIHKHLFQDLYEWAGDLRTTDMMKAGVLFFRPEEFDLRSENFNAMMQQRNQFKGLDKKEFVEGLAVCFSHLNALHPFREGNGRAIKLFLSELSKEAGYDLDFKKIEREEWNQASAEAVLANRGRIERIFDQNIRPLRALSYELDSPGEAMKKHPELVDVYSTEKIFEKYLKDAKVVPENEIGEAMEVMRGNIQKRLDKGEVPTPLELHNPQKDR